MQFTVMEFCFLEITVPLQQANKKCLRRTRHIPVPRRKQSTKLIIIKRHYLFLHKIPTFFKPPSVIIRQECVKGWW